MNKWLSILVGSCIQIGSSSTDFGSISVSGQLPTYPSPKVNVGLGGGEVGSCPDTDIDPRFQSNFIIIASLF